MKWVDEGGIEGGVGEGCGQGTGLGVGTGVQIIFTETGLCTSKVNNSN